MLHNGIKRAGGTPIIAGQLVRVQLTVKQTQSHSVKSAVRTAVAGNKGVGPGNREESSMTDRGLPCLTDLDCPV